MSNNSAYIQIIVPEQFDKSTIRDWFNCVKETLPSGIIGETVIVQKDKTKTVRYYCHKTRNNKFAYIVSLVRNLEISEIHEVVEAWCKIYKSGDFLIDYSQEIDMPEPVPADLEQSKILQILEAWASHQHTKWMNNALEHGWRYGTTMSTKNKTHPWLISWEQLPTPAKEKNISGVKDLLNILKDFGYNIVQTPVA